MKLRDLVPRPQMSAAQLRLQEAAIECVMHGWGIVPASASDGLCYTKGHTQERMPGFEPVLPSARTVRSVRAASSWYALAPYGIGIRAGEDVDVLLAPTWLAVLATGRAEFREHLCPVAIAPSGVSILLSPGAHLAKELAAIRGVEIAPHGTLVALPPSRLIGGRATWWVTPRQVQWRLGEPQAVQDAFFAVLDEAPGTGQSHAE